jgi:hypothetical protein
MEKKMYYKLDNDDVVVTCTIEALNDILEAEATDYTEATNEAEKPQWNITLVWMTEDEYENLPY